MTIQEARALKPGEMSEDRDYYRTVDGRLVKNTHSHVYGHCRTCALKKDEDGIFCNGHMMPGGCGGTGPETWLSVPAYAVKPSKEWTLQDWKEAAEAHAYVEVTYRGQKIAGMLVLHEVTNPHALSSFYVTLSTYTNPYPEATTTWIPGRAYEWNLTGIITWEVTPAGFAARQSELQNDFRVVEAPLSNPACGVSACGVSQTKPGEGTPPEQERDINMSMITKAEKAAASNSNVQAFAALSYGVQSILRKAAAQDPSALQYLNEDGQWKRCTNATFGANKIYRVNPDAQTAPEQRELALKANGQGDYVVQGYSAFSGMGLFAIAANKNTIGIVYEKYGSRNVQKSLSLDFGTPVAVIVEG